MFYKYIIDNNEKYPEDHDSVELIATEKLSFNEFQGLIHKAFELCGGEDVHYTQIAQKIIEMDSRFIQSDIQAIAFVGMESGDYEDKIRGFRQL